MLKVGLFGIGLDTYWPQFDGLLEKLQGYQQDICDKIQSRDIEVINAGMIDNPIKSKAAGDLFRKEDVGLVFLYISTYALSSTVLPIAQKIKVPIILLNLQPVAQLDYEAFNKIDDRGTMTGIWLEHCQACSLPEIASVFNRCDIPYDMVSGYLDDAEAWTEIHDWLKAAHVAHVMKNTRMGLLGHYYSGMLDVYTDLTKQSAVFGTHFEQLEMCELKRLAEEVSGLELEEKKAEFQRHFKISPACEPNELDRAARTSVALDKLVSQHDLDAMAYYYEGQAGNDYEDLVTSLIPGNTLLTGRNIPVAGEHEVKNAQAMKILSAFGAGGSFSEFYLMDFKDNVIYLGHDGPAHYQIAAEKVELVPLPVYHGKPGKGLSIQMEVKNGPITMLSVVEGKEEVFLLVAEGESVSGPTLQIGNTNSRYQFPLNTKEFIKQWSLQGPAHHSAIGLGHIADKIEKLGKLLSVDVVKI